MPTAASWTEVRRAITRRRAPHRLPHLDRPPAARLRAGRRGLRRPHRSRPRRCPRSSRAPAATRATRSTRCPAAAHGDGRRSCSSRSPRRSPPGVAASCSTASTRVVYPVSPTTDHLGALLLAPLNIAWLLQAWLLLGATAYGVERRSLLRRRRSACVIWIVAATARRPGRRLDGGGDPAHARTASRRSAALGAGCSAAAAVLLQLTGTARSRSSTRSRRAGWSSGYVDGFRVALGGVDRRSSWRCSWSPSCSAPIPAHLAARRAPRDELRVETGNYPARRLPRSPLAALVRTDRGSVWRAVPDAPRPRRAGDRARPRRAGRQPGLAAR